MRKIILLFIFILLTLIGEASEIDSLQNILKTTQDDKAKCEVLARISYYYLFRNADTAIYYNKLARDLAEQIGFEKGKALAYNYYGIYLTVGGELPKAEIYYRKSIHLFLSIEDKVGLKDAYNSLAVCFSYGGQYDSSMFYNNKSIELKKELNDLSGLFKAYNNNGVSYFYQGLYDLAIEEYLKATKCVIQVKDTLNIATSYNNIGSVFQELDEVDKAGEYLLKMEELLPKIEDQRLWGYYYYKKAYINTKRGQIDSAIINNHKAIRYLQIVNDLNTISEINLNLSTNFLNKNALDSAYKYIQKVISDAIAQTDSMTMALGYFNLGEYYEKKGNYRKSLNSYQQSLDLAKNIRYLMSQVETYKKLAELSEKTGNLTKAIASQKQYIILKDSLQGIEKEKEILNLEKKYQVQLKDEEIKNLEISQKLKDEQIKKKNFIILFTFILFLLLVLITTYYFWNQKKQYEKNIALFQKDPVVIREMKKKQEIIADDNLIQIAKKIKDFFDNNKNIIKQKSFSEVDLAKEIGSNVTYISNTFSKVLKTSYSNYINTKRIELAKEMMLEADFKLIDIAKLCGYSSYLTFKRAFTKNTGLTPSEYNKILRNKKKYLIS